MYHQEDNNFIYIPEQTYVISASTLLLKEEAEGKLVNLAGRAINTKYFSFIGTCSSNEAFSSAICSSIFIIFPITPSALIFRL